MGSRSPGAGISGPQYLPPYVITSNIGPSGQGAGSRQSHLAQNRGLVVGSLQLLRLTCPSYNYIYIVQYMSAGSILLYTKYTVFSWSVCTVCRAQGLMRQQSNETHK
jgi:hypothetical protein